VPLRVAIVAVAVAAIVFLGLRLREHDRCQSAQAASPLRVAALSKDCRDPDVLAGASVVLLNAGRRADAVRMAREAVRREPDSFAGWVAVAFVTRDRDPAQARRALARAKALNPRWPGLPRAAAQGP
jgi:Flp pilus assembly protein TadD